MTILVATEARFVRRPDGMIASTNGVDAYSFWSRYLDVFDRVLVAARTEPAGAFPMLGLVEGPGVEVRPLPAYRGPWGYLRRRHELGHAMRAALDGADVVCLRAPGAVAGAAWRLGGARPFAVEVVGDPLDSLSRGAVRSVARVPARTALARDLRAMCREAVAVSYVTEATLQCRYPPRGWWTSYSSIDLPEDAFASALALAQRAARTRRASAGTPGDPWRLVTVGSLAQHYKGHDVLLDAFAICRAAGLALELTIVGDGPSRAELEARARGTAVRFLGQRPPGAAVRAVLDEADFFVLPSRAEGLPRALIEAMARGLPAVASRIGGTPELLSDRWLVPPGDARALAAGIERLCAPTVDRAALAVEHRAIASRYGAGLLAERRRELYRRLRSAAEDGVRLPAA